MMRVCIVGAGPAGLMAAIHAGANHAPAWVVETNADAGRKLLLTGGGRCNFTHAAGPEELAKAFGRAGRFLRPSLYELSPDAVRAFFRSRDLADTVEPDGCVFPARGRAADIRRLLVAEAQKHGVQFQYRSRVSDIAVDRDGFRIRAGGREFAAARVILATGGVSWPQTGSTGDGFRFAAHLGHIVVPPRPSLVPLVTRQRWPRELAGLSVPDVIIRAAPPGRKLVTTGSLLFTQNGIGGPAAQDLSRLLADELGEHGAGIDVGIDVVPGWDESQLDRRFQQESQAHPRQAIANTLAEFLPRQLGRVVCDLASCDSDRETGQLSAERRRRLVSVLKRLPLCVTGTEPIARAIVTHGGVDRDEINPRTLESKIRPGLFFAGEVIDLDGPCGGYNLQMCWSTGALAGRSAVRSLFATGPT